MKYKVISPPCRFKRMEESVKLERKINKDIRKRSIAKDRWSKTNSDELVDEYVTRMERWNMLTR